MDRDAHTARTDLLTIAGLIVQVRRWPRTFVATVVLTVVGILAYAWLTAPVYRAVVKVMPRENDNPAGGLQSVIGQLGGLAAMAGLSFGSVNEQEAIALLKSRALFTEFASQQNLMPVLFSKQWDARGQRWRPGLKHIPTIEDAWLAFDRHIRRVTDDAKTQVITLEILWGDPRQAAAWANELVRLANEGLRARALRESAASIASFQEQLGRTESVELRQSIYKLLEVQLNRSAVAKSRLEYALTVIDPAFVPDPKHFEYPRRFLLLIISVPVGLLVAVTVILLMAFAVRTRVDMRRLA
jgi:uncharacterized protein involved in exopolysaccharide biosynthesis